jgi:small subunit ribosomal protein S8
MSMTDPIADMLTRIRNGIRNQRLSVDVPSSGPKIGVAEVLKREGYVKGFDLVEGAPRNSVRVHLKYGPDGSRVISEIKRVSRPGCRVYRSVADLKPFMNGLGIYVVSTPKGIRSDRECRKNRVCGEVLCSVW